MPLFSQSTKICGKLINHKEGKKIYARTHFLYPPEFSSQPANLDSSAIDTLGKFQLIFHQEITGSLELKYEKNTFDVILQANDSLFVNFQYPLNMHTIRFSGNSAAENTLYLELKILETTRKKMGLLYNQMNPQMFLHENDSIKDQEKKLLNSKSAQISETAARFFENEIYYNWANEHFLYIWKRYNTMIKAGDKLPLDSIFLKSIKQFHVSNDSALNNPIYYKFIDSYLNYLMPEYFRGSYIEKPIKNFFLMKFESTENILKGNALNLVRKKIILDAKSAHSNQKTIRLMESILEEKNPAEDRRKP